MAPTPPATVSCGEEEEMSESAANDGVTTPEASLLNVVTDVTARAARNVSLQYFVKEGINATEDAQGRIPRAFYDEGVIAADSYLYPNGNWASRNMTNFSSPEETDYSDQIPPSLSRLHEFQIIKAVVLAAVTVVILISICKMVFQLFVRYTVKQDK
jgi:hypothetical protein